MNNFKLIDRSSEYGFALWTLVFDLQGEKVNKLNAEVMSEFEQVLGRLEKMAQDGSIEALAFVSGKPRHFLAGADINMISTAKTPQDAEAMAHSGHKLANRFEDLPFPKISVIDGICMGGGCELSLACTAIVISDDPGARIGLPETMLGIVPGMGGCIRMPQKVGVATALELILAGKTLDGQKAFRAGLADGVLPKENFETSALQWIKKNLSALKKGDRIGPEPKLGGMGGIAGKAMESNPLTRSIIFKKARDGVIAKTKGNYPAVLEAITVIHDSGTHYHANRRDWLKGEARAQALAIEARAFGKMVVTDISRNLIRLFFMTEAVKRSNGVGRETSADKLKVKSGGVLGAGVMGGGIAQLLAEKGIVCQMKDLNNAALALGIQSASKIFKKQLERRKINPRQYLQKLNLISATLDYSGFKHLDVVIEAVIEKMEIKKSVLKDVENFTSENCVIASNTSSLSITEMQSVMKHPGRFAGMHFFNPVHKMPLVEVIRGEKTSDGAVATVYNFAKQLGKTPIVVKDAPGFLVNRLLGPYLNESMYLLGEGVGMEEIDRAIVNFGMPMGPVELIDEIGVDVAEKVGHVLEDAYGLRMKAAPLNGKLTPSGRLGKKTSKGMYDYDRTGREKKVSSEAYTLMGIHPGTKKIPDAEIVDRCILIMINEAARCLEEGIVGDAGTVDLGMIMGTGFPPFRGGLLRYADTLGAKEIVARLQRYATEVSKERFTPAPALVRMAESGQAFYKS